jgi:putative hydrolase of the HAD superfamily
MTMTGAKDPMRVAAVVFDFDGLLMDTESTMLESWQHEWRHHGLELDLGGFWPGHGGDVNEDRYGQLAAAVGPGYDRAASHARRTTHRNALNRHLDLCPGIAAWLEQGSAAGLRLAVATSSPSSWSRPLLAGVSRLDAFEVIASGDEVARPKPAPDVYLLALDRLRLTPGQAVAVEDSPHGVTAAQAAGMRCIAIPNAHADPGLFMSADLVLSSATDMSLAEALGRAGVSAPSAPRSGNAERGRRRVPPPGSGHAAEPADPGSRRR